MKSKIVIEIETARKGINRRWRDATAEVRSLNAWLIEDDE